MTESSPPPMPALTPPDEKIPSKEGSAHRMAIIAVVLGLVVLLFMIVGVLWILPKIEMPVPATAPAEAPLTPPVEDLEGSRERQEAQEVLQEWLALLVRAEADNIALWGQGEYSRILKTAEAADDALQHYAFEKAKQEYNSAIAQLKELLAQKSAIMETSLQKGHAALLENNPQAAAEAFRRALAIAPDSHEAQKGARRAEVRDEVNALMAEAMAKEDDGDISSALALLTELLALDEEYAPALEASDRITASVEEARFQEAMTTFLSSLERNDLKAARRAYEQAKALRGNDTAVLYAGQRLAAAEEAAQLQALREKAEQQSHKERWSDAVATYTAALRIAPQAIFAVNGQREAKKRAELDAVLVSILSKPEWLQEDGPLQEAEQTLDYAISIADPGPRLQGQIDRLSKLLDVAATPVTVNLTSDNETAIVVYRVGRMGRFLHKSLTLRPGRYTIVGTREGYRDVRIIVNVEPGKEAVNMFIACEEPI